MKKLAWWFSALSLVAVISAAVLIIIADVPNPEAARRDGEVVALTPPTPGGRGPFGLEWLPDISDMALPDAYVPQAAPVELTSPIQRILIEKGARRMTIWQQQGPSKTYQIQLGFDPVGPKSRQGDGRTPEGVYRIDRLNDKSRFRLSLGLDYPQASHRQAASRAGVSPGGDIMIHGQPNTIPAGYRVKGDWTEGCIAVTNDEIEEIFAMARIGTEVEIRP